MWPGYVTAVDEYEEGIMICVDVTHRVLSQATVLSKMEHAHRSAKGNMQEFKTNVVKALLGAVVLTRYNNKTYRIDDIDFEANPMRTFRSKDRDVTYVEYYKSHYNIDLKDLKQPLLISRKERRVQGQEGTETLTFCLIPEICFLTGLSDELRADFRASDRSNRSRHVLNILDNCFGSLFLRTGHEGHCNVYTNHAQSTRSRIGKILQAGQFGARGKGCPRWLGSVN